MKKLVLFSLLLIHISSSAQASHRKGGFITYTHQEGAPLFHYLYRLQG